MERLTPFTGPSIRLTEDQTVALNMLAQDADELEYVWIAEQDAIGNLVVHVERSGCLGTHTYKINRIGEIAPKEGAPAIG